MELPNIDNVLRDEKNNVTFIIKAYRQLTEREKRVAVSYYLYGQKKKPKIKRGSRITIHSLIE